MSGDKPVKEQAKFIVRMTDDLRDELKAQAASNKRSMNAEIIDRLEKSFHLAERLSRILYEGERIAAAYDRLLSSLGHENSASHVEYLRSALDADPESVLLPLSYGDIDSLAASLTTECKDSSRVSLPDDLAEAIERAGAMQGRSMEDQAIHTLDTAYSNPKTILERRKRQ